MLAVSATADPDTNNAENTCFKDEMRMKSSLSR
jgi:hypothetical protein